MAFDEVPSRTSIECAVLQLALKLTMRDEYPDELARAIR